MKTFLLVALFAALVTPLYAQTTDDGIMMPSRSLQAWRRRHRRHSWRKTSQK